MFRKILISCLFLTLIPLAKSQTARDVAVETYAKFVSGKGLYIKWIPDNTAIKYYVSKRVSPKMDWVFLDSVNGSDTQYLDKTMALGRKAEYRVSKSKPTFSFYANGYILSGFEMPAQINQGKVLLILDSNYVVPLKKELSAYKDQLTREGWTIASLTVLRTATISSIKNWIKNQWNADSANIKTILLLGRIPVPYSGNYRPDGHLDHTGAWPADVWYGSFQTNWTDNSVNNTQASRTENQNVPGDGKFDISRINPVGTALSAMQSVQIPVGRVDMFNMGSFGNDTMLMKRYLTKDLNFRRGVFKPMNRGLIDDNFGYFSSEAFASGGFRNFSVQFKDSVFERDYFTSMKKNSYLMSYGCGGGTYTDCSGVGSSANFVTDSLLNPFTMTFGSYFGDWDNADNFLRAPLASKGWGLANVWSGRPYWMLHECALGIPLWQATLTSVNSYYFYNAAGYMSAVHTALMGDPTLTLYPLAEMQGVKLSAPCTKKLTISWNKHSMGIDSVLLEEKVSGVWKRLNTIAATDTQMVYTLNPGYHMLSVRPIKLMKSASGSWWQYGARQYHETYINVPAAALLLYSSNKVCLGDSVQGAQFNMGTGPFARKTWVLDGKNLKDTAKDVKIAPAVGIHNFKLILTTDSGCVSADSVAITVRPIPTGKTSLKPFNVVCLNANLNLQSYDTSVINYWWQNTDTLGSKNNFSYLEKTPGKYIIKHKVTFVNTGCSKTTFDTVLVTNPLNTKLLLQPHDSICQNESLVASGLDTTLTHQWKIGTAVSGGKSVTLSTVNSGIFTFSHYTTNVYGCKDSVSTPYFVRKAPTMPVISVVKSAKNLGDSLILKTNSLGNKLFWWGTSKGSDSQLIWKVVNLGDTFKVTWFVKVQDKFGCNSDSAMYSQSFYPSSVWSATHLLNNLYPNPAANRIYFDYSEKVNQVTIVAMDGTVVNCEFKKVDGKTYSAILPAVSPGIYQLRVQGIQSLKMSPLIVE